MKKAIITLILALITASSNAHAWFFIYIPTSAIKKAFAEKPKPKEPEAQKQETEQETPKPQEPELEKPKEMPNITERNSK